MNATLRLLFFIVCTVAGVSARAQVVANFTASPTSGCSPLVVSFTNTSTGSNLSYSWNFGNSITSTLANPSTTYTSPGSYTVTLVTTGTGGSSTKTATITVNPSPTVSFSATPTSGCAPLTVAFSNASTPNMPGTTTYLWNFGNGQSSTAQNPSYTFTQAGTYNIALQVTNSGGCQTTVQQTGMITAHAKPTVGFSADTVVCGTPGTVQFVNTSTGGAPLSYFWTFGNATTSTAAAPTATYTANGSYTVSLAVVTAAGCTDTLTKPAYIDVVTPPTASFTAPTNGCTNAPISVAATGTTGTNVSYEWDFGNGAGTYTGSIATSSYYTPGTYTIRHITIRGACRDTAFSTITIAASPVVNFSILPQAPCPAPVTMSFGNLSSGAVSYVWKFGDGSSSTAVSPTHTYGQDGYYTVTLIATSSNGCVDSLKKLDSVRIRPLILYAEAIPTEGCAPLTTKLKYNAQTLDTASVLVPYPFPIVSTVWDFGDGTATSTLDSPMHTYTAVGIYTARVIITTANGCVDTAFTTISVGSPPTLAFTASPLNVCLKEAVTFTNQSSGAQGYSWYVDGDFFSNAVNPVYPFLIPDTITITLVGTNNGCVDSLVKTDYIVVRGPAAQDSIVYSCTQPRFVRFFNITKGYDTARWYFGDGTTASANAPVNHTYPALGNYNASLVVWSATTGCRDSMNIPIHLYDLSADFLTNDTTLCVGDSVTFTATITGAPPAPMSYRWMLGNYMHPDTTLSQITMGAAARGRYNVRLLIADPRNCKDTAVKLQHVLFSKPQINFTAAPPTACAPALVQFNDATSHVPGVFAVSRFWDFGNSNTLSGNNPGPTQLYTAAGQYTISLAVTDNIGCSDTLVKPNWLIVEDPEAAFNAPASVCAGAPIAFTNASTDAVSYQWAFGNGQFSNSPNPTTTYATAGTYTVRLIASTASGCADTVLQSVTVNAIPNAAFTVSDTFAICSPHVVQFTNNSTGANAYQWALAPGAASTLTNPSHVYGAGGVYTVRLIAIGAGGCRDTATATVTVLGYAGALQYGPLTGCAPLTVNFSHSLQNVPSFVFDFADGTTFGTTGNSATHTYTTPGKYVPRLIMSDNQGCSSSSIGLDTVRVDGVVAGFTYTPYPACGSGTFTLVDTSRGMFSGIASRTWVLQGGVTSTAPNPTQTYPGPGTYPVTIISTTTTGCKDTFVSGITVHPIPVVSAGTDTIVCVGDAATLSPTGGVSYTWAPPIGLSCVACTSPQASPPVPTQYIVTGTDANGCKDTDTVLVGTKTTTVAAVGLGGEICQRDTLRLRASGAQTYVWTPGAGLDNPSSPNPVARPDTTTLYTLTSRDGSCIPDIDTVRVIVHPLSGVDAGPDVTIVAGQTAQLNATTKISPVQFAWSPPEWLSCVLCPNPEATPPRTTTYTVVARTTQGCVDSSDVTVRVICEANQIYIPNTFTPNGDGDNDRFFPRGQGLERIDLFRVYSRWGELVYERRDVAANDESSAWDGTVRGADAPPDVFVYIIEGRCTTGESFRWQGDVALIR